MQCNIMMHDHDMATCLCFELMQLATKLNEVGLNPKFKIKLHMCLFNVIYANCPEQQP